MLTAARIDVMLSTLNSTDVGTIESIVTRLRQVQEDLVSLDQAELAARAHLVIEALKNGDLPEFRRGRAYLQSKIGHLRR